MDNKEILIDKNEKPLDRLVEGYSHTSLFRRIAFIGDSLSSGEFETEDAAGNRGYHDMFEYSWGQHIARQNGITAYSFSRGGMTAREYLNSFAEEKGYWDADKACQAYVIALGVNDVYNDGGEIGRVEDDVNVNDWRLNKPNFIGNYAAIVSRYKEIAPDAKFFFVTVPNEGRTDTHNTLGIIDALYDLTRVFENSYVIDLYKHGPKYDEAFKSIYMLYSHMSPAGYLLTARMIDSYIDYIIRHNPDDFKNVAFIGSGINY